MSSKRAWLFAHGAYSPTGTLVMGSSPDISFPGHGYFHEKHTLRIARPRHPMTSRKCSERAARNCGRIAQRVWAIPRRWMLRSTQHCYSGELTAEISRPVVKASRTPEALRSEGSGALLRAADRVQATSCLGNRAPPRSEASFSTRRLVSHDCP